MRPSAPIAFAALVVSVLVPGLASAQGSKLYKWVDENGNVHYSDRVEASAASSDVRRISDSGIQLDVPHSALPTNRDEVRQHDEARRLAQLDTMLLASYRTELELLRSHDESREPIENGLRAAEGNIARLKQELARRQSGATAPAGVAEHPDVTKLREQIAGEEASLEKLRARRFELYERQNFEVSRYRELTTRNG
jgi:hypothetical protein